MQKNRLAISVSETADAMGISRLLVMELIRMGNSPCKHLGRRFIIPVEALDEWLKFAQP
jgi:excisionase family DNA binding protein